MTAYTIPTLPALPTATGNDPRATLLAYYSGGNGTGAVPANFLNRQSSLAEIRMSERALGTCRSISSRSTWRVRTAFSTSFRN